MNYNCIVKFGTDELKEENMSTENAWRVSVVIPEELEKKIVELRKMDRFSRSSLSEIIRTLISKGLEADQSA